MKRLAVILFILFHLELSAGTIVSNLTSLPSFGNCVVGVASTAQKITISGTGLTAQLLITPPTGFEVSTNWISEFGSRPIILTPVAGVISSTQIFVRIAPLSVGAASGNLVVSSAGSNTVNIALTGVGTNWTIPTSGGNYYSSTSGLSGSALKTALYNKILGHNSQSYTPGVWNAFATTDVYFNGKVWDIYSVNTSGTFPYEYTLVTDQCGTYAVEGDCYNREHTFPQSWFNSTSPMVSDLHHLYASDGKVNAMHNNFPYSDVAVVSSTSLIGCKLGTNAITSPGGYTGTVFEITDEYKGDIARSYFYMAARYENLIASWQNNGNANDVLAGNSFPAYDNWFINLLVKWHNLDPVSSKEINRNNAIFAIQNNRNPFVDSPQFVQKIWGGASPNKPTVASSNVSVDLQSASPVSFNIKWKSGNGNRRIVIVRAGTPVNAIPTDSIEYLASSSFGSGSQIGSGNYVVYNGMGSNFVLNNCLNGTTYYFAVYEYNGYQKGVQYMASAATAGSFMYLPVKLILFEAKQKSISEVELAWKTANEINNSKFCIERKSDNDVWEQIGTVNGKGTTNKLSVYRYNDNLNKDILRTEEVFYRLKQIDFDGKYEYSQAVKVVLEKPNLAEDWAIIQNPIESELLIDVNTTRETKLVISIKNTLGNELYQNEKKLSKGKQIIAINDIDWLPSGIYFLQIQDGTNASYKRFFKQ